MGVDTRSFTFKSRHYDTTKRITGRALQTRRLSVWTKDPCCAVCRRLTAFPRGFELDVVVPLFKDGEDTEANCQILCVSRDGKSPGCHERKTADDLGFRLKIQIGPDGYPLE